jgi:hypothetical protein
VEDLIYCFAAKSAFYMAEEKLRWDLHFLT